MADITIADVRRKYPQYNDLSDQELASSLHSKFYADMPRADFDKKIGLSATSFTPAEREVADAPMEGRERQQRLFSSYVPGSERIRAATLATLPFMMDERINEGGWGDRYDRALRIMRHRDDRAQREGRDLTSLATRTAGAGTAMIGTGAGNLAYRVLTPVIEAGARLPAIMRESARIGGGMGAITGLADSRGNNPWDQSVDTVAGTLGGAAVGATLPAAFVGFDRIRNFARRPFESMRAGGDRVPAQRNIVEDWNEAVPDARVPGAIVSESPALQGATRRVANTPVGGRVQDDLERGADALTRRVRERITSEGLPDAADHAVDSQAFLRRNLTQYSRDHGEIETADRFKLRNIADRSSVDETYPTQMSARYRLAETNPIEGYGRAENIRGNFVDRFPAARANTPRAIVQDALARHREAKAANKALPKWAPEEVDALVDQWRFARRTYQTHPAGLSTFVRQSGGLQDHAGEVAHMVGGTRRGDPGLFRNNGSTLDDMALQAWEAGYFPDHRQRPSINDFLAKLQDDLQGRRVYSVHDGNRLEDVRLADEMWRELGELGIGVRQRSEKAVRRVLTGEAFPRASAEPKPQHKVVSQPTATYELLNRFGQEARAAGALKGWKEHDFNDEFWAMLKDRLGSTVAGRLQSEAARVADGARPQANIRLPGLRQQRTLVRRNIEDIQDSYPPTGTENLASLRRLHGSMTDDMQRIMNESGPGGRQAASFYREVDEGYRQFVEDVRAPLAKIFGRTVPPDVGMRRLMQATQNSTFDGQVLRAYSRVLLSKSRDQEAVSRATRMLLTPMTEGGLPGFLKAWDNMHPSAKRILSMGDRALFSDLDRYARLARRFEPFEKIIGSDRSGKVLTTGNLAWGVWALSHLPSAVAAAGGANALARFLSSPRYVQWLTKASKFNRGGMNDRVTRDHLNRLHAIAGADPEIGQVVTDVIGPSRAQAGLDPRPERVEEREPLIPPTNIMPDDDTRDEEHDRNIYIDNPTAMMRLGGPRDGPRKSRTEREVAVSRLTNQGALERFAEPARGMAGTVTRMAQDVPEAFNRLLQYKPGTGDEQAPVDALTLGSLATAGGLGGSAPRGAVAAGLPRRLRSANDAQRWQMGGRNVGTVNRHEQMVRFREGMRDGESVAKIAKETGLSKQEVRGLIDMYYGERLFQVRGMPFPEHEKKPGDFWDHDNNGAFMNGRFGRYWGDDRAGNDSYDEGIVRKRDDLDNPEGGQMRHYDPWDVYKNRTYGRGPQGDTEGRLGLHFRDRDGAGRFAAPGLRGGNRSRKRQDRLEKESR